MDEINPIRAQGAAFCYAVAAPIFDVKQIGDESAPMCQEFLKEHNVAFLFIAMLLFYTCTVKLNYESDLGIHSTLLEKD